MFSVAPLTYYAFQLPKGAECARPNFIQVTTSSLKGRMVSLSARLHALSHAASLARLLLAVDLSDPEIASLIAEAKALPDGYQARITPKPKRGHKERDLDVTGDQGSEFRIISRESISNPMDFSLILAYRLPGSTRVFRLRRYNGRSHQHSNVIEGERFYDFHIHMATERYQALGAREDAYAELTDRYSDIRSAMNCMAEDCGFEVPKNPQESLFG